jgi:FkbM family methyltransferase
MEIKLNNNHILEIDIEPGDCVIDCGANIGEMTNLFQSNGATVIAFEPNKHAFKILEERFKSNFRVKTINKGVAGIKSSGIRKLFLHEEAEKNQVIYSTGSSILEDKNNVNKDTFVEAEFVDLCNFLKFFPKKIKLLKIDIEGAEVELLNDLMNEGLLKNIEYVFVETHEEKIPTLLTTTNELRERIKKENYTNINLNWI